MSRSHLALRGALASACTALLATATIGWAPRQPRAPEPASTGSAPAVYEIDQAHSQVLFRVKHLGISTVTGRFREFSGTIAFDPANAVTSRAEATIRTASIDTDNDRRDTHLRSADFFETEKYPEMRFATQRVRAKGRANAQLQGQLTMHGVTRPITLEVQHMGSVKGPDGRERVAFTATTQLDRTDYGLNWNRALESGGVVVGKEVDIILEIAAIRRP